MKTIKVRIALAVDPNGYWSASGWPGTDGEPATDAAMDSVVDSVSPGERRYWIEAEVEVPEDNTETVRGTVTEAED